MESRLQANEPRMRPAFSSLRQAVGFTLLLLAFLVAPALAGKKLLPPRREIYSSIWWANGDFPYMDGQIFQDKGDLDIVFMGSSHIWAGLDSPSIQEQLSQQTGRPAAVRTFGWGGPGFDALYLIAQDVLSQRHVHMLVLDDGYSTTDQPHTLTAQMFRFGDDADALTGLPAPFQAAYYFASIAGMPRNVLSLARTNLSADMDAPSYWETNSRALNIPRNLGAITTRVGFRDSSGVVAPFVAYTPQTGAQPSDVCLYSPETKTNFVFGGSLPAMQLHFAQKLAASAQAHDTRLVIIHMPTFDERRSTVISMPVCWPDALHADVTLIGIPPATLFQGLTDDDIRKLYSDSVHFNQNGQNYFTRLMAPNLLKIYESSIQKP